MANNPSVRPSRHSLLVPAFVVACGSADSRPPSITPSDDLDISSISQFDSGALDDRDEFASGQCEVGGMQQCRIYLPEQNGVQPCFVGEQHCQEGAWSDCLDPALVDANTDDSPIALSDISGVEGE